ncbi:MAG: DUF1987 domain-containing protein [Bacteroidales bacterium]|nr:DUF1987 domain-containing protein [Bacteroidales bacterium]
MKLSYPVKNDNLAFNLFENIQGSTMEYTYRGSFTTKVTDTILSLTESNLQHDNVEKKVRKRVFFIIVEGLQNVTRHQSSGKSDELAGYPGLFVVQYKPDGYYITTGNLIKNSHQDTIKEQIDKINDLDKEELKKYSLKVLDEGEFSDKGGAGLGLIEIARKSGCNLVYDFEKVNDEFSFFYLHTKIIDFIGKEAVEDTESIKRIIKRHKILEQENILLNFIGAFTQDTLVNLLSITENQLQGTVILKMKVFNLMVEILQNIVNHADEFVFNNIKGKHAIFYIRETDEKLVFTSGNYILNHKITDFKEKLENVNSMTEDQLSDVYNETLLNFDNESDENPGLGLLDIKLKSKTPFNFDFYKINDKFSFFTLKIYINKMKDGLEKYIIQEEDDTPEIFLDSKEGVIRFKGKSIPENAVSFFKPIIDWLNIYKDEPADQTKVSFEFDYYNTATDRQLVKILLILEEISKNNRVDVEWFYNTGDISMLNDGKKFKELIDINVEIIELVDEDDEDLI